ncbi:MAG TPA: FHA domain-containing protein [Solirubrobacteraceae bacterium]|nr:FHA domain-containing protein [Solirubrobacteraceae bacterium]
MLQPVSVALKFGFLAVLYLFLIWVAWSALRDMRRGPRGRGAPEPVSPADATSMHDAVSGLEPDANGFEPRLLVERAPGHEPGVAYDIPESGATLGRGDVEIQIEDPFASARHARITRQGYVLVIEDLGSTNGTYLNEEPLNGPQPLHPGDRIRIGDSEFSYLQ